MFFFSLYRRFKRPSALCKNKKIVHLTKCFSICSREELHYYFTCSRPPINEYGLILIIRFFTVRYTTMRLRLGREPPMYVPHVGTSETMAGVCRSYQGGCDATQNGPTTADHSGGPPITAATDRHRGARSGGILHFRRVGRGIRFRACARCWPVPNRVVYTRINDGDPRAHNTPDRSYVGPPVDFETSSPRHYAEILLKLVLNTVCFNHTLLGTAPLIAFLVDPSAQLECTGRFVADHLELYDRIFRTHHVETDDDNMCTCPRTDVLSETVGQYPH